MKTSVPRVVARPSSSDALNGQVSWSPIKSLWISVMYLVGIVGSVYTFSSEAFLLFLVTCAITLCGGHSLGMHRRLIHNSFQCPLWLEYLLVYLGVLVGLSGPLGLMKTHDMRDWAQRQFRCHSYFGHKQAFLKDWFWQVHCDISLFSGPEFQPELRVIDDKFYRFMERTWMWQQLPWIILFGVVGGISWVVWGVFLRVAVCVTGHWLIGYFAHNRGVKHWHVDGAAVQGYNIPCMGLITMGECWHNNHHAFPGSAKLGLHHNETDPGWWVLRILEKIGLVWDIQEPNDLLPRSELKKVKVLKGGYSSSCRFLRVLKKVTHCG